MPIPLLVWGAVAAATAAAAAGTAIAFSRKANAAKDQGGQVVAILGPRRVGKTSLARFIADGVDLPIEYSPTKIHRSRQARFEGTVGGKPWILETVDFGGSPEQVREWRESRYAAEANVVWFLASAEDLLNDEARQLTVDLARAVVDDQLRHRRMLVVTHADLDADFDGAREESMTVSDEVERLRMILGADVTVIGSLASNEHGQWLADTLLGATRT